MLEFTINSEGTAYTVTGLLDRTLTKVIIPDTYNGLPVTVVSAFFGDAQSVKEVYFGHNVEETTFDVINSQWLEKIYFGKSIRTITGPFYLAENLKHIYYGGTEEEWQNVRIAYTDEMAENFQNAEKHFGILGKASYLTFGEETVFPYTHWDCVKNKPESIESRKISYDNSISGLESENVKDAIDELNAKHFDTTDIESWTSLLHLVRSGRAKDLINIGDQLVSTKNGTELVWDVIGIDADTPVDEDKKHSLTLQLRDCYINMPFSVPEASFCVLSSLKAGQYYIEIMNYSSPSKFYSFTLDEDMSAGSCIRISENLVYLYNSREESSYASFAVDSVSDSEEDMIGRKLDGSNYHIHCEMGTVNYDKSEIRRWLNSAEEDWWTAVNSYSLAPTDYLTVPGFCNMMDEDFLNAVNPVKKKTIVADGSEVITEDKFFLLSSEEVYAAPGTAYEYYKNNSSLSSPDTLKDNIRVKTLDMNPRHWWLRDSAGGDIGLVRVLTDGGVGTLKFAKVLGYGVAPACCIC